MDEPGRRGRFLRYAPLIIWIGVIFIASTTSGSMSNTSRFVRPFLVWLFPNAPEDLIAVYHGYVRKSAHVVEYAVLAFWAALAFRASARRVISDYWQLFAFLVVLVTASLDEFNQSFNLARTGTVNDVLLDCAGGLATIVVLSAVQMIGRR